MAATVIQEGSTSMSVELMSHLCLIAWNDRAGPTSTLNHTKDKSLRTAEIAPGVPTGISGNLSLNLKGARVITRRLANVGIPSSMTNGIVVTQAQPNGGILMSIAIGLRTIPSQIRLLMTSHRC